MTTDPARGPWRKHVTYIIMGKRSRACSAFYFGSRAESVVPFAKPLRTRRRRVICDSTFVDVFISHLPFHVLHVVYVFFFLFGNIFFASRHRFVRSTVVHIIIFFFFWSCELFDIKSFTLVVFIILFRRNQRVWSSLATITYWTCCWTGWHPSRLEPPRI